jgi:hypothetical protein
MARPARVRMRSRKPWVFARLRLFGWNVRFTGTTPLGRSRWKAGKGPVHRWHRSTDGTGLRKQASTRPAGHYGAVIPPSVAGVLEAYRNGTPSVARHRAPRQRKPSGSTSRVACSEPPPGWGQPWGRAVDERGTTAAGLLDRADLGTTTGPVPSRILIVIRRVSSADGRLSTCPQDLWFLRGFSLLTSIQTNSLGTERKDELLAHTL